MLQVCRDRIARGVDFDNKLKQFWKRKYSKTKSGHGSGDSEDMVAKKRKRVTIQNDFTIHDLVRKCDNKDNTPVMAAEQWEDNELEETTISF